MFDDDEIRGSFDEITYRRGLAYAQSGRVVQLGEAAGTIVSAKVQGSARAPYNVTIEYVTRGPDLRFSTYCDCPIGNQCKHGAAALIALLLLRPANEDGAPTKEHDPADVAVSGWLRRLEAFSARASTAPQFEEIRYFLDLGGNPARVKLTAREVSVRGNGERTVGHTVDLSSFHFGGGSDAAPIDRTIGRLAVAAGIVNPYSYSSRNAIVSPRLSAVLLEEMLRTGRLHWRSLKAPPLLRRDLSEQRLVWNPDAEGRQHPGVAEKPSLRVLPSNPTWYVDPESNECGTIDLGIAAEAVIVILEAPPLTPRSARSVQAAWKRAFGENGVPAPHPTEDIVERDPVPVLLLRGFSAPPPAAVAELTFEYGAHGVELSADEPDAFESIERGRHSLAPP